MAMPASGCIAIIASPQTCGSIRTAVTSSSSGSLSTLSVAAGKGAPHGMREFYGYTGGISLKFGSATVIGSNAYCCDIYVPVTITGRKSPNVVTVCFCATASLGKLTGVCYYTSENSGGWSSKGSGPSVSFTQTGIDYNDSLCVRMILNDYGEYGTISDSTLCLWSTPAVFTTGSGSVTRCSPYNCTSVLGVT